MNVKAIIFYAFMCIAAIVGLFIGAFNGCGGSPTDWSIQERDQRSNIPFELAMKVVDQDGHSLKGVRIDARVHIFSDDWASKGNSHRSAQINRVIVTQANGVAVLKDRGSDVFVDNVQQSGYSWLKDLVLSDTENAPCGRGTTFGLSTVGNLGPYTPDKSRPVIFVMVQDGVHEVHVKPSPGGYLAPRYIGQTKCTPIPSQWPRKPSIPGVRFVPSSQPLTGS